MAPAYSAPLRVTSQVAPSTYRLEDGSRWNATHLIATSSSSTDGESPPSETATHPPLPETRRSHRTTRRPAQHSGFHVDYRLHIALRRLC